MNEIQAENLIRSALKEKDELYIRSLSESTLSQRILRRVAIRLEAEGYCKYMRDSRRGKWKIVLTKESIKERRKRQIKNFEAVLEQGESTVFRLELPEENRDFWGDNFSTMKIYNKRTGILTRLVTEYMKDGFAYVPGHIHRGPGYLIIPRDLYLIIATEVCQPLNDGTCFRLIPTDLEAEDVWVAYSRDISIKEKLEEDSLDSSYFR